MGATAAAARPGRLEHLVGPFIVLRGNRAFTLLFAVYALSTLIDWLYGLALFVLAYDFTHSATIVGLLTFARLLPYAIVVPFAGTLSDRSNRATLLIAANIGRALCLFGLMAVHSKATLPLAFALAFGGSLLASVFRPTVLSLIPDVVPERELVHANSVMSEVDLVSFGAGPALAALILLVASAHAALFTGGIGFLIAAAAVPFAGFPARPAAADILEEQGWLGQTASGLHFLFREHRAVLGAIALTLAGLTLYGGAYWAISLVLADGAFGVGGEGVGLFNAVYALGGLVGGFLVGPLIVRRGITAVFIGGAALSSIAEGLFGLSPAGAGPFLAWSLVGLADAFAKISAATIIQTATPHHLLGRVFGSIEALFRLSMVIGALVVGPLIGVMGVRAASLLLALTGLSLLVVSGPLLLRLEDVIGMRMFLRAVPVLNLVPFRLLDDLVGRLTLERYAHGEVIVREGDRGDRFCIVKRGEVEVLSQADSAGETLLATLCHREYFGETALLRDVPRTATVRARGAAEVYSLSRADFQDLRRHSGEFEQNVQDRSRARDMDRRSKLTLRA